MEVFLTFDFQKRYEHHFDLECKVKEAKKNKNYERATAFQSIVDKIEPHMKTDKILTVFDVDQLVSLVSLHDRRVWLGEFAVIADDISRKQQRKLEKAAHNLRKKFKVICSRDLSSYGLPSLNDDNTERAMGTVSDGRGDQGFADYPVDRQTDCAEIISSGLNDDSRTTQENALVSSSELMSVSSADTTKVEDVVLGGDAIDISVSAAMPMPQSPTSVAKWDILKENQPCPQTVKERVNVYWQDEDGKWEHQGTGHVSVDYMERSEDVALSVIDEHNGIILSHRIRRDDIYHKHEADTIISWRDPEFSFELELRFEETAGCCHLWDHICNVQRNLRLSSLNHDTLHSLNNELHEMPDVELSTLPLKVDGSSATGSYSSASGRLPMSPIQPKDVQIIEKDGSKEIHEKKKRVKVYRQAEDGRWEHHGTGYVRVDYMDMRSEDFALFVVDDENQTLLLHQICPDDIYHKQGADTIISWRDPEFAFEFELRFQETAGCCYIWDHICNVQRNLHFDTLNHDTFHSELRKMPAVELSTLPSILKVQSSPDGLSATGSSLLASSVSMLPIQLDPNLNPKIQDAVIGSSALPTTQVDTFHSVNNELCEISEELSAFSLTLKAGDGRWEHYGTGYGLVDYMEICPDDIYHKQEGSTLMPGVEASAMF